MWPRSWQPDEVKKEAETRATVPTPTPDPLVSDLTVADLLYSLDASYNVLRAESGNCYDPDLRRDMECRLETIRAMRQWFRSQKFLDEVRARRQR